MENYKKLLKEKLNKDLMTLSLICKWMPRKGLQAKVLRNHFHMTPKQWRKMLVEFTNVVETPMCNKEWKVIDYNHVPSLAISRYKNAFLKNDEIRYKKWLEALKTGKDGVKINAGAVYPYDIIKAMKQSSSTIQRATAERQWEALPNFMTDTSFKVMPIIDTSGSMESIVGGTTSCLDVAVSLGMYIAERNVGPYQNHFITFSAAPTLQRIEGSTLWDKYNFLKRAHWDGNTNLEAAFDLILDRAVRFGVSPEDMPTHVLIISDMEFDNCVTTSGSGWSAPRISVNAMDMIRKKYANAGYERPNVIFWNIQSRHDNIPVKKHETGAALVSGFSPSILKSILTGSIDPIKVMMNTINVDRYKEIAA